MDLTPGQVAVVTGAASGIGFAFANALRAEGLEVVMADVEGPALVQAAESIGGHAVTVDVSKREEVSALASSVVHEFGHVDLICNNAGVSLDLLPTWELDPLDWEWVIGVNLMGVIHGISAFVPTLCDRAAAML
jgi:NADP-dependent 3-hydroxy acid dehydrogenase YdfG